MFNHCLDAENEFERCWSNPDYTAIQLEDVDVNRALMHYVTERPIEFTRSMLWDMERKKAWNPGLYIPYVIKAGSARSWNKQACPKTGGELFVRRSTQKKWLDPQAYEDVYEEVYVNEQKQLITFLGVTTLPGVAEIHPTQSLFHVQHGVRGDETHPQNTWRIVHLTQHKEIRLINAFKKMNEATVLPGFIKVYIEHDLHTAINRK